MLTLARLPPILIGDQPCLLPLAEPTAVALLAALVAAQQAEARAGLADAVTLDPALALWACCHYARGAGAELPPTVVDLQEWLSANLSALVAREATVDSGPPTSKIKLPPRAKLAELAAKDVARAEPAIGAGEASSDARYLVALLAGARQWLVAAGCSGDLAVQMLPGWLTPELRPREQPRGGRAAARGGQKNARLKVQASARVRAARERWQVQPGFATLFFANSGPRLARLGQLEADFSDRLEQEKLEALAEFAAGAGHEINNPLAVISGRAQLFLRNEKDPERRRDLALINSQARRVHEMIADLMLFARPPVPRRADCDVAQIVETVVAELAGRATESVVRIAVHCDEDLPTIHADATQLQVALRAVCENSLDALGPNGRVEITAQRQDASEPSPLAGEGVTDYVAITICDNGPGMPPEVRRHAFDPFYSGRGAGRGLGNGLSKCWRIVTSHGGRVEIDSTEAGTTVRIWLLTPGSSTSHDTSSLRQ